MVWTMPNMICRSISATNVLPSNRIDRMAQVDRFHGPLSAAQRVRSVMSGDLGQPGVGTQEKCYPRPGRLQKQRRVSVRI